MNRREFVKSVAAASATIPFIKPGIAASNGFSFNCFSKHLQWLDYAETAEVLKAAGYDGVDLTVRPGGHVLPERMEDDLPKAVEAFEAAGLQVPMIVTSIRRVDEPHARKTLEVAAQLGVNIYRMGYLSYSKELSIEQSLMQLRPQVQELADFNRQLGISGAYQNHSGTRVGGPVWDLHILLEGIAKDHLGIQYDIKHAVAEGGRSWSVGLKLVAEHINCLALKDFLWIQRDNGTWRDAPVPMGTGMVDYDEFFEWIKQLGIVCPITMHLEYEMPHQILKDASHKEKKEHEVFVYNRDLAVAKENMRSVGLL